MQKFCFSLESAMQYRQMQVEMQRAKLESLYSELRRLNARKQSLIEEKEFAEAMVKGVDPSFALSLMALDNFSRHIKNEQTTLERQRTECFRLIAQQQTNLVNAQRDYDLLRKLREKKLAAWQRAADTEQEQLASDAHLAGLARETARNRSSKDGNVAVQ
jgi:hypothetical protein